MANYTYKNDLPDDFKASNIIAIDTETMGLNPVRDQLCLLQLSNGDGDAHLVKFDRKDYSAPNLKRIISDENIVKIFHYARFDIMMIKYYLETNCPNVYCTKIASKLVRTYGAYHGLKDLCAELMKISLSKQQQSSDWGSEILSDDQIKYAAQDVLYLHSLKEKLDYMLAREGREEIAKSSFDYLKTRVELDILGFEDMDIFAHS